MASGLPPVGRGFINHGGQSDQSERLFISGIQAPDELLRRRGWGWQGETGGEAERRFGGFRGGSSVSA